MADPRPAGQSRVPGRRSVRHVVMLTPEQEEKAKAKANARGLSIARLMADLATDAPAVDNRVLIRQLSAVRRMANGVAVNVNQAAKEANSGRFDPDTWAKTADGVETLNQNLGKYFGWDK